MSWQTDIGLEIHVQLQTKSKLFSNASTKFGNSPNTATSFIDAGLPGTLPVLNREAVKQAIKFALACNARVNNNSYFERKNYFYPDLPKGYQITQNTLPIMSNGKLEICLENSKYKTIHIHHAHLEEDAGKLIHNDLLDYTQIDLNRAGNPLLEIVTTPCMHSAKEAIIFLKDLHRLVRFLDICDGNMQEGSFRCDVNISVRKNTSEILGTKTEIKNLNSFKFIEKAIEYEINRQRDILVNSTNIQQETRLYCPSSNKTISMRNKESAIDYRYFLEPDLKAIEITKTDIELIRSKLTKLPNVIKAELLNAGIVTDDVEFILSSVQCYNFYQEVTKLTDMPVQQVINWLKGSLAEIINEKNLSFANPPISSANFAILLSKIYSQEISKSVGKQIIREIAYSDNDLQTIIKKHQQSPQISDTELKQIIQNILNANPKQVAEYKAGKEKLLAYFVGQTLKATKGQAEVEEINKIIKKITRT